MGEWEVVVVMVVEMAEVVFRALVLEVTVPQAAQPLSSPDSGDLGKSGASALWPTHRKCTMQ